MWPEDLSKLQFPECLVAGAKPVKIVQEKVNEESWQRLNLFWHAFLLGKNLLHQSLEKDSQTLAVINAFVVPQDSLWFVM